MYQIRRSAERGLTLNDWLKSYHSFSFADYYDAQQMGFGALRVINEDTVQAARGFSTHSHKNMEIVSYVLEGALAHRDSMGNESVINAGEFQVMSAGTGVKHSEFNSSQEKSVHFLQIWIIPAEENLTPSYQQKAFAAKAGQLVLVASQDGRENSLVIHQQISLYVATLNNQQAINYALSQSHEVWIQVITGQVTVNHLSLSAGDGMAITNEQSIELKSDNQVELLLFDLLKA